MSKILLKDKNNQLKDIKKECLKRYSISLSVAIGYWPGDKMKY